MYDLSDRKKQAQTETRTQAHSHTNGQAHSYRRNLADLTKN